LISGVDPLVADRIDREQFARVIEDSKLEWDMVVDCIGYVPEDVHQDMEVFRNRTQQLVFISTDFVFDPAHRKFPQPVESDFYAESGYGGNKRLCEMELAYGNLGDTEFTVFRPCHIYGPGSELGCLPNHARDPELVSKLKNNVPVSLVGGGHFLQQPVYAEDLANLILSAVGNKSAYGRIFNAAGPDIIESKTYYKIIADVLEVELTFIEFPVDECLSASPELAPFLTHRIYDLDDLSGSGLRVPSTSIQDGLRKHTESILARQA
jgi:nucleoside-diphosphate-sugar epimerase